MATDSTAVEVFSERGDIILQVGSAPQTERKLFVSSVQLSIASPVFVAMLDGRSSEGQALSTTVPKVLPHPDDDADPIALICNIIHRQTFEVSTAISAGELVKVAILADKYDCVNVIPPWSIVWTISLLQKPNSGLGHLPFTAYVFDLPDELFQVSRSMMRDSSEPLKIAAALNGHDFLPTRVLDLVLSNQHDARKRALALIDEVITGTETCEEARGKVGACLTKFYVKGNLPLRMPSVLYLKTKLNTLAIKLFVTKGIIVFNINCIYNGVKGLCLDCVKSTETGTDRTCRFSHEAEGSIKNYGGALVLPARVVRQKDATDIHPRQPIDQNSMQKAVHMPSQLGGGISLRYGIVFATHVGVLNQRVCLS